MGRVRTVRCGWVVAAGVSVLAIPHVGSGTPVTERVSVSSDGGEVSDGYSYNWTNLNGDGQVVMFDAARRAFFPGETTRSFQDVIVRDRRAGTTERISVSSTGVPGDQESWVTSRSQGLSADGRFAVFMSWAENLVPGDTNGYPDVFVRDRVAGTTIRVSVNNDGSQRATGGYWAAISPNGRFIAFAPSSWNVSPSSGEGVFVRDRVAGTTRQAMVSGNVRYLSVSSDGGLVAYNREVNTAAGTRTRSSEVMNMATGTAQRVDRGADGSPDPQAASYWQMPDMAANGRYVAFSARSDGLVDGDNNGSFDVFVRDRIAETTQLISQSMSGTAAGGASDATISANGRFIAFDSTSSELVPYPDVGEVGKLSSRRPSTRSETARPPATTPKATRSPLSPRAGRLPPTRPSGRSSVPSTHAV